MNRKNTISNILEKYMQGECTNDELKKALNIFSDPYCSCRLKPLLSWLWEKYTNDNSKVLSSVESQKRVLEKIHRRICLRVQGIYLN